MESDLITSSPESELDLSYNEISEFVCEEGPELLTRGMPPLIANQAILACLKKLKQERDDARNR